jgi:DNA-binding transcriptional ArsR family regulator
VDVDALGRAAECLRSIAHPIRLQLVELLLQGEYTVGELAEECGSQSHIVSEHLGLMRDRGLLSRERRGRRTYYRVAMPALEGIIACVQCNFGCAEP